MLYHNGLQLDMRLSCPSRIDRCDDRDKLAQRIGSRRAARRRAGRTWSLVLFQDGTEPDGRIDHQMTQRRRRWQPRNPELRASWHDMGWYWRTQRRRRRNM